MALTQADKNEIINALKAESQGVDELPIVSSLDGIVSLPAIRGTEVVSVPVSLLRKPAEDAAGTANAAAADANSAATSAFNAANDATAAAESADEAAQEADRAAEKAYDAVTAAQGVVSDYESTAIAARNGATARFSRFVQLDATTENMSIVSEDGEIVFLPSKKAFAFLVNGK